MQDETIYKLVTMLGEAISGEKSQRLFGIAIESANVRLEHENTKLRKRIAELDASLAQAKEIIDQQSAAMRAHDERALDEDRLSPWEPIPDNVQRIACGSFSGSVYFSIDDDGRLVKVESQGNSIVMNLGDMRICCRRGTWAPF